MHYYLKTATKEQKRTFLLQGCCLAVLFLALFYPTYGHLYGRFTQPGSYYSHGFLIPIVCGYLLWRKRKRLSEVRLRPNAWGLGLAGWGIILHFFGVALRLNFASYLAIIIVLGGFILYLFGVPFLKQVLFELFFLLFMMPLPQVIIIGVSFHMKIFAAQLATLMVKLMNVPCLRYGSTIYLPNGSLEVGDPCSGLRSLISFLALGVLFTQFTDAKIGKRLLLVACTVPIALLSNVIRIMVLILVTYVYGEEATLGFVHDFTGIMVFVLGFIGFIAASRILRCHLTTDIS